ncbi:MAG: citrate lyase ACP [Deltaproteobacteria bacterium]|nr:citrate lyase ACP [Deltaproteobacteria bacterium]
MKKPEARGEAGRHGERVRSDVHVAVTLGGSSIEIVLESKVELYYGEAIVQQVRGVMAELGVEAAKVEIHDAGAMPFVIAARVETAARRAGVKVRRKRCAVVRGATAQDALRRSRLYLPGNEPKFMVSAGLHGADGLIFDLEDAVHPAEKDAARLVVREALLTLDFGDAERMVRINQLPLGLEDLDDIIPACPDLILIPKTEQAEQVRQVDARIRDIHGVDKTRQVWLMPIIESALGVENAYAIASASERVVAVTMGLEDYTADLGVVKTSAGDESRWARGRVVNAARAAGVQAIDSVYGDVADKEGLMAWARRSRDMGFTGMGCVHPRQVTPIHQAFAPSAQEIARALKISAAFAEAEAQGLGVVSLGSKMIDAPVVKRALKLVRRARAMGLVDKETNEVSHA